jgi:hypothetical protein
VADSERVGDLRPLPIYMDGAPSDADVQRLRVAKESLNLPFKVVPRPAAPGGAERVLAIGIHPDWAQDYAFVPSTDSPGLREAVEWALTDKVDSRATSAAKWLSSVLGAEVKEVDNENAGAR